MAASALSVLVAAPPTLQRQGLLVTLRDARPDLCLAATADAYGLPQRLRHEPPQLLILANGLPGPPLADLLEQVQVARPGQRLLVLGQQRLPLAVRRRLAELTAEALLAHSPLDQILRTIARLLPPLLTAEAPAAVVATNPWRASTRSGLLSARELEVLRLVADDLDNVEIAARLFLSVRTVESHRRTLLQKAGTRTVVALAVRGMREGWLV